MFYFDSCLLAEKRHKVCGPPDQREKALIHVKDL